MAKHSFQSKWFKTWKWLHYIESEDVVFCYTCDKAVNGKGMEASETSSESHLFLVCLPTGKMPSGNLEDMKSLLYFISQGHCNALHFPCIALHFPCSIC